ncbi:methyltransferase type 11 [Geothermobacter hydrogeniphilus]|uniref:Methyltransferase type 11 n=2 Tax=Geothermobacter hydrogeniphilus TaxID=1969733 RepID=A0A1X0Y653_9BACT|nr:methyltransferase domain-containing selenoprotein MduS [Geothermobacter hydrogeniphilus]ORJ60599.1 methyltransferase type 11 [Geothermobacter hydrogeniphilus]
MKPEPEANIEQRAHWDEVFTRAEMFFGDEPSRFAQDALEHFRQSGVNSLLELGCGQGRDSFLFAQNGFDVTALDYSEAAVSQVNEKAAKVDLSKHIRALAHDLREPLPFADASFDACYSHMLLCMKFSTVEIAYILQETHRILKPGGLAAYSVRSSFDKHFRSGTHLQEEMYEIGDFVVHFFSEGKIRRLSKGYKILDIKRLEEGSLPRDLFCVTLKKEPAPESWDLDPNEEIEMSDPLAKFQTFMDAALAPGHLNHKTKQLVALGAALAAGCDP